MTIRELITVGHNGTKYGLRKYPPFNEKRYEVAPNKIKDGEPVSKFYEDVLASPYADRDVWLAFHSEGNMQDIHGENVFTLCITGGWN